MSAVAKIPKPNFNRIQGSRMLRQIYISFAVAGLSGYAVQKFVIEEQNKKHDEFYRTYNPWEDFERMRQLGLFQSCPPDEVLAEREAKKKQKK